MELKVVEKSFVDKKTNETIGYKALAVVEEIEGIKVEMCFAPADDSKLVKKCLIDMINQGALLEVAVHKKVVKDKVYKSICVHVDALGDVPLKVTSSDTDKFVLEFAEKLGI